MADRTGAAVVVVRHLSKSGDAAAIYRGQGSIGIIGAARLGLLVAPNPDVEGGRVLAVTKSNLAPIPRALSYRLVPHGQTAVVSWEGPTSHLASQLVASAYDNEEKSALEEAKEVLRSLLENGAMPAQEAAEAARDAAQVAPATLRRARKALGVVLKKHGQPGQAQHWEWSLPVEDAQRARR